MKSSYKAAITMFYKAPKISRITQPVLDSILSTRFGADIVLDGRSLEIMYAIQGELDIFEPIDDDDCRLIWLEIPRGTVEEWEEAYGGEDLSSEEDEQDFLDEFPRETQWVFLTICTYRGYTGLRISDRDYRYRVLCNENRSTDSVKQDMAWFLNPLLELIRQRIAEVVKDPEAHYHHIESCLPYRQRSGRIRSSDLNRILGRHLDVNNRDYCIGVMQELIRRRKIYECNGADRRELGVPEPFGEMTIRTFCRYYRIADTAFWRGSGRTCENPQGGCSGDDVDYYSRHGMHGNLDAYDLDSQADFVEFARDHYGELGLSRMNVCASDSYVKGKWLITFNFSYSASLETALRIAVALYETGEPLIFHGAENVLHALQETGWVRLSPFTYHDYIKAGDDEGVFELPYAEDCGREGEITRQQYDEVVRCAEWQPLTRLHIERVIPLESPLYDSIRNQVREPLTVSRVRNMIQERYDVCFTVAQDEMTGRYYPMSLYYKDRHIDVPRDFYVTYNEAMAAMILLFNNEIRL